MIDVSERDFITIQGFLAKYVSECDVWAFGSRATWTAKEHSDLDLVIVGPNKPEARALESLKEAFDESALPFRVDILDWQRISPEFKRNIEKNYVVIRKAVQISTNGWRYYKVSDFAEVVGGGTPKTGVPEYWGGEIPWITPKDLSDHNERFIARGERSITKEGLKNSAARLVPENTVLLTSRAPVGYLAIAKKPLTTNQGFRSLIIKEGFIPEFIYYLLLNNVDYLKQHASGSTFQELSGGTLKNLQFQIPALPEQRAIAKNLSDLDEKIELNQQVNKTLEAIGQALFRQWFVDFEFPGCQKTKFIDGLPEGWREGCLGDILEISIGGDWGEDNAFEGATQAISLRGTDLDALKSSGFAAQAPIRWIRKDKLKKRVVNNCDLLIGGSGLGPIGKSIYCSDYLSSLYDLPVTYSNFCKRLTAKSAAFAAFAEIVLENMYMSGEMAQFYTGTSIPNLDVNSLLKYPLIIPDLNIASKFYQIARQKFSKLFNKENIMLAKIRDSILPKLMTGQIKVN